ncbi:UNVERIFIED_CONTAM: hypothetical protein FKN15_064113 [Acipenser sinensis]
MGSLKAPCEEEDTSIQEPLAELRHLGRTTILSECDLVLSCSCSSTVFEILSEIALTLQPSKLRSQCNRPTQYQLLSAFQFTSIQLF